jgi:ketosteroid isomerase-like protein
METRGHTAGQVDADTAIELTQAFTDAWNRHDVETLMAMFHPEGTLTTPAFPTPLSGKALQGYLQAQLAAFPDIKAEPVGDKLLGMDTISGRYFITGTWTKAMTAGPLAGMTPTGKSFKMQSADFLDIRDGKIAAWTQYYDRMALLTQLGIIPPR